MTKAAAIPAANDQDRRERRLGRFNKVRSTTRAIRASSITCGRPSFSKLSCRLSSKAQSEQD